MINMRIRADRRPSSLSKTAFRSHSRILSLHPIRKNYTPGDVACKDKSDERGNGSARKWIFCGLIRFLRLRTSSRGFMKGAGRRKAIGKEVLGWGSKNSG